MKYRILVILTLLLIVSCGSSSTTTDDAATTGGILSADVEETDDASIESNDSLLLASFIELGYQINNIDSLLLLIQSADSIMRDSIFNMILGDTLTSYSSVSDSGEEVEKDSTATSQAEKDSTSESTKTDPHAFAKSSVKPPSGRIKLFNYQSFGSAQPKNYSKEKSFPRYLRGTYYNTENRNYELIVTKYALLYGKTKLDTIFKITDTTTIKIEQNTFLLSYLQSGPEIQNPYWVTDQMILTKDTLFFKTIPTGTLSEYPTRRQIKDYLKSNNTPVISSYSKLK